MIGECMMDMSQGKLYLRPAVMEDKEMLFRWRNDPICRKNSVNTDRIEFNSHCLWLSEKLSSSKCDIFICMKQDIPIGQVRVDYEGKVGKISYSIAHEFRGAGYGFRVLELLEEKEKGKGNLHMLCALVKKNNIASMRCFQMLGYNKANKGDFIYYSKVLYREDRW